MNQYLYRAFLRSITTSAITPSQIHVAARVASATGPGSVRDDHAAKAARQAHYGSEHHVAAQARCPQAAGSTSSTSVQGNTETCKLLTGSVDLITRHRGVGADRERPAPAPSPSSTAAPPYPGFPTLRRRGLRDLDDVSVWLGAGGAKARPRLIVDKSTGGVPSWPTERAADFNQSATRGEQHAEEFRLHPEGSRALVQVLADLAIKYD